MVNMKKLLSIILSIFICMTLFSGTASANTNNVDIDQMAAALNRLNILQGNNGDYLLYDNLQRSQAVAFIIRMLGKEDYVKEHVEELKSTNYPDVPESSWYAPYVGYSTIHNIVGGNLDGSFAPLDYVTEKAFLKMALCALDYEYGVDFNWSNVYQKAYEVGIVTDESYSTRTDDDTDYLRSQAIEVLYRALNTYKNGTQTKMILSLVDDGSFTKEEVAASGIFSDENETKIKSVTAVAPNALEVVLNEDIQNVEAEDISIYDASDEDDILKVQSVELDDNIIQITTAGQEPGKRYEIEINGIVDEEGNVSGPVHSTFEGYASREIKSDFFRISKVEQISRNIYHVYFTHPVNENSETPTYYELIKNGTVLIEGSAQNMTVKKLQAQDNAVSIYLDGGIFSEGEVYMLRVSGKLTSGYGVRLGEGDGDSYSFVFTETESEQLKILSVQGWTSDSVRIIFNREIDIGWAAKKLNYTVFDQDKDEITVINAVVSTSGDFSGREVFLSLSGSLMKENKYELAIEYIPDVYKQSVVENIRKEFSGTYPTNKKLQLSRATSPYNNCVLLTFNKAVNQADVLNTDNYIIRGENVSYSAKPVKVYYSERNGTYTAKLFMPADDIMTKSKRYSVYVSKLKDSLGNAGSSSMDDEFTAGSENTKQWISDAVTISKDAVKVTFNTEIAFNPTNLSASNYALEYEENGGTYRMVPMGVTYVDVTTLILRFDELDSDKTYRLRFNTITDYSEEYVLKDADVSKPIKVEWGE
jgi:hypothetical protein